MTSRLIQDPAYGLLKGFVIESTGLAYYVDKDEDLAGRIERRMSKRRAQDCAAYLRLLKDGHDGEAELDALIAELTIGETYFLRHRELFDALRDLVLPDLIERNRHTRRLRIWSAGCATGPEPYSVAILLRRELGRQRLDRNRALPLASECRRQTPSRSGCRGRCYGRRPRT
jgi:chemotaxis protein methyltransferase CheR